MTSPFVHKLRRAVPLSDKDADQLEHLVWPARQMTRGQDLRVEGDPPHSLTLIHDGWAARYKQLADGRRQIISLFLPGDLCEPYGTLPRFMAYSLGTLTPVRFARIRPDDLRALARSNARIDKALWWDVLAQSAIQREQVVSLGRRSAMERFAHLICELHLRLGLVGMAEACSFHMPLTQAQLADMLGLTAVHVNRTFKDLRRAELISMQRKQLMIADLAELQTLALFDPNYLHLDQSAGLTQDHDSSRQGRKAEKAPPA